jgi:GNAT superfamily N-acetyltransferase
VSRDRFLPVTQQATAGDLELFSATYGTFRWCSCQRWRLRSTPFREAGKKGRVAALAGQVAAGEPVGVLAYDGDEGEGPVGWCSIAPRESYAAILASRVIPQVPGERVWSVVCFFIAPRARRQGLRPELLDAACGYAAAAGAAVIEAYPSPDGRAYRYMGTRELYRAAGFEEVPVPPNSRPVMRKPVEAGTVEAGTVEAGTVEAGTVEAGIRV